MSFSRRFKEIFRSAFKELSFAKRWLLRIALALLAVGGGALAWGAFGGGEEPGWSLTALSSGAGCLAGFLAGAAFRVFLKLALLLGLLVAGVLFGLSALGWMELPWSSFSEISAAVAGFIHTESASVHEFLTGWLPSSGMTGLGLASGITQRPDMDPDD